MGIYRYYMTPPEMVKPEELPDKWGLLWVNPKTVKVVKKPTYFDQKDAAIAEMPLLCSALRRVELRGDLDKIYDIKEVFA
jgi:hypothetical protein